MKKIVIFLCLTATLFAIPALAQAGRDTLRMPAYTDLMRSAPMKVNPDTVFHHIATRTYAENLEELFCYYEERVLNLSPEELEQEIERMKQAALRYRSEKPEAEAEYLAAYSEETDPIAAMQPVLSHAEARGDLYMTLRAREFIIVRAYRAQYFHVLFPHILKQLADLEKVSPQDFPRQTILLSSYRQNLSRLRRLRPRHSSFSESPAQQPCMAYLLRPGKSPVTPFAMELFCLRQSVGQRRILFPLHTRQLRPGIISSHIRLSGGHPTGTYCRPPQAIRRSPAPLPESRSGVDRL